MHMNTASKPAKSTEETLQDCTHRFHTCGQQAPIPFLRRDCRDLPVELCNCSPNFKLAWKPTPWSKRQTWLTVASRHMPSMEKLKQSTCQHGTSSKMGLNPKRQRGGLGRSPHLCLNLVHASCLQKKFCHGRHHAGCLWRTQYSWWPNSRKFLQ